MSYKIIFNKYKKYMLALSINPILDRSLEFSIDKIFSLKMRRSLFMLYFIAYFCQILKHPP